MNVLQISLIHSLILKYNIIREFILIQKAISMPNTDCTRRGVGDGGG